MDHSDAPQSATRKFAFFGPSDKHFVTEGGFCISVFAIIRKKGNVLLVKPRQHPRWQEWAPNWRVYESKSLTAEIGKCRIPSTYVREGEAPEDGLRRVMEDQLGVSQYSAGSSLLLNFYEPSRRYPGKMHWDYCFVFEVSTKEEMSEKPWLAEVTSVDPSGARPELGSSHGEILERVGSVWRERLQ